MMTRGEVLAIGAVLVALLSSCGSAPEQPKLTVLAAASLTDAYGEMGSRFEAEHPGVRVRFDFQGSSTLAEQLRQGRSADVFASADERNMDKVVRSGVAEGDPAMFATNRLTIAVPPGNPEGIASLGDLADPARTVVACAEQVPCGAATAAATRAAGVNLRPASEENDVKSVLRKVEAGEADAGLVYVTDALSAGEKVSAVDFPESHQAVNDYPLVQLDSAEHPRLAQEFVDFVRSPAGREVLHRNGFGTP